MYSKNCFPDFLIVGAAKSGTSSLHSYLNAHPDIFLPPEKELYFWHINRNPNKAILKYWEGKREIPLTLKDYLAHFDEAKTNQIKGEATPSYLYYHKYVTQSLKELCPDYRNIKIIIILREPVDRIFSEYRFVKKMGHDPENLDFEESLKAEPRRLKNNNVLLDLFYTSLSKYPEQVKAYLHAFNNVEIVLYDSLKKDSQKLTEQLCRFVGADPMKLPALYNRIYNQAKTLEELRPLAKSLSSLVKPIWDRTPEGLIKKTIRKSAFKEKKIEIGPIRSDLVTQLYEKFLPEIIELEGLSGLDLSSWKKLYESKIHV